MSRGNLPARYDDERGAMAPPVEHIEAEEDNFAPYRMINQYLRGRYIASIAFGLGLAGLFAVGGWFFMKPAYRSEALLRIAYDIPRVMQQAPDYKPMEVFEAFMQSQQALIQSHRVLSSALQSPIWKERGFDANPGAIDAFAGSLAVEHKGGTEHLKIVYVSDNPQFAATAVQSTVDAYVRLYNSMDQKSASEKTAALEARQKELSARIEQLDNALRAEAVEFGSSNVERFYDAAVARLTRVESSLIDVRIALAMTHSVRGGGPVRFTPQQIARFDPTMARYMGERENLETSLEQLRLRGYGEEHREVIRTQKSLELVSNRIRDYAVDFQNTQPTAVPPGAAAAAPAAGLVGRSADDLEADEASLQTLNREVKEQLASLGAKKLKVDAVKVEMDKAKADLTELTTSLASMHLESGLSGRLSVMSNGEVPLLPFRDRRLHLAAAGAMAGFFLPAAGFVAVGMSRRRYRYSMDATDDLSKDVTLLGILPQLPARLTDPESAADAAQCLHQIRVMLQVQQSSHSPMAYLMTSSCPGEGKTSLCAALALSFAAAGARTLVVDADLIGQRLTRGYRMDDKPGFREAMQGTRKSIAYYPSGVANLSVLPAGVSDGRDACSVSTKMVKRLVTGMKEQFDVVLVDSGPILGSLEALVVAQHVDGVILTISREQQKPLVDRAIRQLRSVRATIAGMVFNKAESADFKRSVGASSLRSIPRNPESGALMKAGMTSTSGFGSLVDSVQTYMPGTA